MMVNSATEFNPFPGLRPFEFDEEHLFFGREGQTNDMLVRLKRRRFLAVVGTSGSGKSSLVRAGLLPSLYSGSMRGAGSHWRVVLFRPGDAPIANLANALSQPDVLGTTEVEDDLRSLVIDTTLRRSSLGLVNVVQQARLASNENLLVVVDQFEELFRFKQRSTKEAVGNEATAFVKLLLEAIQQPEGRIYVVLTMRSDFLGDCAQFQDLPEAINDSQYLIPRLTRDQRRLAIEGPIKVAGAKIEPRLVDRLLNDMGDNPDQLPILQHALMRTWDNWVEDHGPDEPIDLRHYEAIGGMATALSQHADEIYAGLPDEQSRNIAERLFKCLTDRGSEGRGVRRPIKLGQICAIANADLLAVIQVVEEFRKPGRTFVMPPVEVELNQTTMLDISHESLMRSWERLKTWVDQEWDSARIYRRIAETAELHELGEAGLWGNPDLRRALEWREKLQPNQLWAELYDSGESRFEQAMRFLEMSLSAQMEADPEGRAAYIEASATPQVEQDRLVIPDVYISYSRRDRQFVEKLLDALKQNGFKTWIDWENIPAGSDWRQEIKNGIERSQTLLFVMSPDSVTSQYCRGDVEYANQLNKRILTVVWRREYEANQIHPALKERNWLYLDQPDTFDEAISSLIAALKRDQDYVKIHTNVLLSALDWDKNKRRKDFLLRGAKLREANRWLKQSQERDSALTELQQEFITASQDRENQLIKFVAGAAIGSTLIGVALLASVLIAQAIGKISTLVSLSDSKQELDGLQVGLEAGKIFVEFHGLTGWLIDQVDPSIRAKVVTALNQSVYDLHEINRLEGHTDRIYRAIFSHDGSLIASASQDGTVRLWKPDGTLLRTLAGHLDGVSSIDFSPNDQLLASSSNDGTVKLWDVKAAQTKDKNPLVRTFSGHSAAVFRVQFSSDGQLIASASQDGTVRLWTPAGIEKAVLPHGSPVYNLSFSPDSQQLISASANGVQLWNRIDHFKASKHLSDQAALSVVFSPDGSRIAASELEGNNISLWDNKGTLLATMTGHQDKVNRIVFSPNNQWIASVSDDNTVRLWDRNGKFLKVLRGHQASVKRVQFSPDNRLLATTGADGTINLWNMDGTLIDSLKRHKNDIWDINFSPDGKLLASAGADTTVKLWRPESSFIQRLPNDNYALDINFSPNQKFIAASSYYTIQFWTANGQRAGQIPNAHQGAIQSISTSPDGQLLASAGEDGKIKLWTLTWEDNNLKKTTPLRLHVPVSSRSSHISVVAFSPNGQQLASAIDGFVQLWQRGRTVMNGSVNFGQPKQMEGNRGVVNSVAFSRDGQLLAAGSSKISPAKPVGEVMLWQTDGTLIRKFEAHGNLPLGNIFSVSLSPDGQYLAAADSDNTIKVWKLIYNSFDGKLVDVIPFRLLEGHTASVLKVAYSPNGKLIASVSQDGTIKLWDAVSGELISTLKKHEAPVSSLSFSSDSKMLVSGGYDTKAFLWQIPDNFDREALNNLLHEGCRSLSDYLETNKNLNSASQRQREELRSFCKGVIRFR